ncbi:MAG: DUF308 domain-containing protein [Gammaproteobacteria bacterium]
MQHAPVDQRPAQSANHWLKTYYFTRGAFSIAWIALAVTIASNAPLLAGALLVVYPAWDALANYVDAKKNGGLKSNLSQTLNLAVSALTTLSVAIALGVSMNAVLAVFGVWAILSGLFQLITAVRRWKSYGAQWAMILSGAQSALAGTFFFKQAAGSAIPDITAIAPYAAFGAFYFLVSAIWLTVKDARSRSAHVAT